MISVIVPEKEDELARRFDFLVYTISLAFLQSNNATQPIHKMIATAEALSRLYNIPQVKAQQATIEKVKSEELWESASVLERDAVREALRDLMQYIEKEKQKIYYTDFTDEIIGFSEGSSLYHANFLGKH